MINTQLIGQVDHENVNANPSDNVVLKLNTVKETDYYVAFNRKSGFNSGTREGGNQVMITSAPREAGVGAPSQLLFKLSQGNSYTIPAFREVGLNAFPLTVEVNSINTSVNPGRADVSIYECIQDSDCDDLSSCKESRLVMHCQGFVSLELLLLTAAAMACVSQAPVKISLHALLMVAVAEQIVYLLRPHFLQTPVMHMETSSRFRPWQTWPL